MRSKLTSLKCPIWRSHFKDISFLLVLGVAKTQISVSGKRKNFTKQEGGVHEPIHVIDQLIRFGHMADTDCYFQ